MRILVDKGATPLRRPVPRDFGDFSLTALDHVLALWNLETHRAQNDPDNSAEDKASNMRHLNQVSHAYFDILLSSPAAQRVLNHLYVTNSQGDEKRAVTALQFQVATSYSRNIFDYFLAKADRELLAATDTMGMNVAMLAAAYGDLETLRKIADRFPTETVRELFNYRSQTNYKPTILHFAISSLYIGAAKSAEEVYAVMRFLVEHGADPGQRSVLHNLFEEIRFGESEVHEQMNARILDPTSGATRLIRLDTLRRLLRQDSRFAATNNPFDCGDSMSGLQQPQDRRPN